MVAILSLYFFMAITFKEVIYNIKNLRQAGRQSQDALLSDVQYAFIINQYRSKLLGQDVDRRKALAPQVEQTIQAKFERVRSLEQDVFQSLEVYKVSLPTVVQSSTRPLYQAVRRSLLSPSFPRSTNVSIRNDMQAPLTGNMPRFFPLGEVLHVVTPEPLQELFVTAVFFNPLAVEIYLDRLNPFDPFSFNYPIDPNTLDGLYKMMTDAEIKLSMITPNDLLADGKEEPYVQRPLGRQQAAQPATTSDSE